MVILRLYALICGLVIANELGAMHQANRYLPFLEQPATRAPQKGGKLSASVLYEFSSAAFDYEGERLGVYEIYGTYNLKDVIDSLGASKTRIDRITFTNPFIADNPITGGSFADKNIIFNVGGKVRSNGVMIEYQHALSPRWSVGAWVSLFEIATTQQFFVNTSKTHIGFDLLSGDLDTIDRVRRSVHQQLGLDGPDVVRSGIGDVDLYVAHRNHWRRRLLMRSIDLALRWGVIIPTSPDRVPNRPSSVPFMGDGHVGWYMDAHPECELRQDIRVGCMTGLLYQSPRTRVERMAVGSEPFIFSALSGRMRRQPGLTLKISPYVIVENLTDGVHVQLRYTYLRHGGDVLSDWRSIESRAALAPNLSTAIDRSAWTMKLLTFQVTYDSAEAMKQWKFAPKISAAYDFPLEWFKGRNAVKHHQFTFGIELSV